MRRLVLTAVCASALFLTTGAPALGDSHNKPLFEVQCGDLSFIVTSPDNAVAGQDLDSTHVLVANHGRMPEAQTMVCTVTLPGEESETVLMLIKPATH